MKKKTEPVKQLRRRRSNLEMAGFSREHLRIIKRISDASQVSLSTVGTDVIEIGMAAVVSKYQPMIEWAQERKERTKKLKELFNDEPSNGETTGRGGPEEPHEVVTVWHQSDSGSSDPGISHGVTLDLSTATLKRPGDDDERSGHEPEADEVTGDHNLSNNDDIMFGS